MAAFKKTHKAKTTTANRHRHPSSPPRIKTESVQLAKSRGFNPASGDGQHPKHAMTLRLRPSDPQSITLACSIPLSEPIRKSRPKQLLKTKHLKAKKKQRVNQETEQRRSAAKESFGVVELFENILRYLPPWDILRFRKVNDRWRDIIDDSAVIQGRTFLKSESQPLRGRIYARRPSEQLGTGSNLLEINSSFLRPHLLERHQFGIMPLLGLHGLQVVPQRGHGFCVLQDPSKRYRRNDAQPQMFLSEPPTESVVIPFRFKFKCKMSEGMFQHRRAWKGELVEQYDLPIVKPDGVRWKDVVELFQAGEISPEGEERVNMKVDMQEIRIWLDDIRLRQDHLGQWNREAEYRSGFPFCSERILRSVPKDSYSSGTEYHWDRSRREYQSEHTGLAVKQNTLRRDRDAGVSIWYA